MRQVLVNEPALYILPVFTPFCYSRLDCPKANIAKSTRLKLSPALSLFNIILNFGISYTMYFCSAPNFFNISAASATSFGLLPLLLLLTALFLFSFRSCCSCWGKTLREGFKYSSSIDKWNRPLIFTPPTH